MKVALIAASALLAGASPALAQVDSAVETGNCQGAFFLNRAPSAVIVIQSVPIRPQTHLVRPPAPVAPAGAGSSPGSSGASTSGIGSISTLGIGTLSRSGIGTISQSGVGAMTDSGIGSIGPSGFGPPPVQSSPSSLSAPATRPGAQKNAVAPPLAVSPPLFVAVCP